MALGSHLITNNDAAWRWVISSLVYALTHCVSLVVEVSIRAWFYRRSKASLAVGLDGVEADDTG